MSVLRKKTEIEIAVEGHEELRRHDIAQTGMAGISLEPQKVEAQAGRGVEEKGEIAVIKPLLYQLLQKFPRLRRFLEASEAINARHKLSEALGVEQCPCCGSKLVEKHNDSTRLFA